MSRRILTGLLCLACLGATIRLTATDTKLGDVPLPAELAAGIEGAIKINDPAWLVQQAGIISTSLHVADLSGRSLLAEFLFTSADLRGVDLGRPGLIAWRDGRAPLLALIPIADRKKFLKSFGVVKHVDRFMVQTGERDGTIVFSQSTLQGLDEYRMLFKDGYAYLARTTEECQLLAANPLAIPEPSAPALRMSGTGEAIGNLLTRFWGEVEPPAGLDPEQEMPWLDLLGTSMPSLFREIAVAELIARGEKDGTLNLTLNLSAVADTDLAAWFGRQTNSSSRLIPLVERPGDIATLHGDIRWKGEMEAIGRITIKALQEQLGGELAPDLEGDLRSYFRMLDNREDFAVSWAVHLQRPDMEQPQVQVGLTARSIAEQNRGTEFLTVLRSVDKIFRPQRQIGDFGAFAGLVTYSAPHPSPVLHRLVVGDRARVMTVIAADEAQAKVAAQGIITALGQVHPPSGRSGICVLRLHLAEFAKQVASVTGRRFVATGAFPVDINLKSGGKQGLSLTTSFHLQELSLLFGRAGVGQLHELELVRPKPAVEPVEEVEEPAADEEAGQVSDKPAEEPSKPVNEGVLGPRRRGG